MGGLLATSNLRPNAAILVSLFLLAQPVPAATVPAIDSHALVVRLEGAAGSLAVSLRSPQLVFEADEATGGASPAAIAGDLAAGEAVRVSFAPAALASGGTAEVALFVQWFPDESVLRKWAELRLTSTEAARLLTKVTLEEIPLEGRAIDFAPAPPQSYPAFLPGFFVGVEYPVAWTRLVAERLVVEHRPGAKLSPGAVYRTRTAVYGITPPGQERQTFEHYVAAHRPGPTGLHINYNSWWTSSVPFTQDEILRLMATFNENLYRPHGAAFDSFTIDMGWSNPKSLWRIDETLFPDGFAKIQAAAERMGSRLGLWISPSSMYPPALDNNWAEADGYETFRHPWVGGTTMRVACLGGSNYAGAFRERLVEMVSQYGIRQIKLDGYIFECPEAGHGHAPGQLSSEQIAAGAVAAFDAVREAAPDTWMEATCFGWNPSPWWLWHVTSVIGSFGDDAPRGRVPAPVYRESYTTARDFFNLQGMAHVPIPAAAQEVLGVIHQTEEPFLNDAVTALMRGHGFMPMYIHPRFMNDTRWKDLTDVIAWARANPLAYEHTQPILPVSWRGGNAPRLTNEAAMPREPYGYAHWSEGRGLVLLRNPWIAPATIEVAIPAGMKAAALTAVSLYPHVRVYGEALAPGGAISVPLAPYETLVLALDAAQQINGLPRAADAVGSKIVVTDLLTTVARVEYTGDAELRPDATPLADPGDTCIEATIQCRVQSSAPRTRVLVLLEGADTPPPPITLECVAGGIPVPMTPGSSDAGWSATGMPPGPDRWLFLEGDLPGNADVPMTLKLAAACARLSVWIYATAPGGPASLYPNALPAPEIASLDAAALFEPMDVASISEVFQRPVPVERIDGIYLDALTPASATTGWGTLQRNRSITETPMTIGGRTFRRGLGTHAPSVIAYDLDGEYVTFHAWAGAQGATGATVTFEVRVDGETRWQRGLTTAADRAQEVTVDLQAAKRLELIVTDANNTNAADHANWGDAKLLR